MTEIEIVAENGRRRPVPRGWILLTLTLASWGVVCLIGLVIWGLASLLL
jgi:hypothetical protein